MARKGELTPKQQRFVEEYLVDFNASAAARRSGYSEKTAPFIGAENIKKPLVAAAIEAGRAALAPKAEMDAIEWRRRVTQLARFDVRKLYDPETGNLRPVNELPDDVAGCVSSVRHSRERKMGQSDVVESLVEVKSHSVEKALEMMGKALGTLKDTVTVEFNRADLLRAGRDRVAAAAAAPRRLTDG